MKSILLKKNKAFFEIEISEGRFETLDTSENPYIDEFILCTNYTTMKSVFGINLKSSFEIYLIDLNTKKVRLLDFWALEKARLVRISGTISRERMINCQNIYGIGLTLPLAPGLASSQANLRDTKGFRLPSSRLLASNYTWQYMGGTKEAFNMNSTPAK